MVRLIADSKTARYALCVVPGREEAVLVTVPFFAKATWMLPGTFEDLPPPHHDPWKAFFPPPFLTHSSEVGRE